MESVDLAMAARVRIRTRVVATEEVAIQMTRAMTPLIIQIRRKAAPTVQLERVPIDRAQLQVN